MSRLKLNTLDIDSGDIDNITMIICKILECKTRDKSFVAVKHTLKGYHVIFYCTTNCDMCRLVFDDQTRYSRDLERPEYSRNVLFTEKRYI